MVAPMKYSVNLLYAGVRQDGTIPLWEERIILVDAVDEEQAKNKATDFARDQEVGFCVESGDKVDWVFKKIERVFMIDGPISDGCELFSRFLREPEVDSILTPFDD